MTAADFAPVTLVTGPEELLRDRAVAKVIGQVRKADAAAQVQDLSAVGLEPGRVSALASPSLFGESTVIVVRDLADAADAISDEIKAYAASPAPDVALVLVHPGGVKGKALLDAVRKSGAVVVECKPVKWDSDKVAFVQSEFAAARRSISPDAASALVDALGSDLRDHLGDRPVAQQLLRPGDEGDGGEFGGSHRGHATAARRRA